MIGAGQPAGTEEGQDACLPAGARAPAVPRAGLPGDHGGADRRGGRGVAVHVLPVLPDEGRRGPPGRHGHPAGGGVRQAAAGPRPDPRGPRRACGRRGTRSPPRNGSRSGRAASSPCEVPEIRARSMNEFSRMISVIAEALASRTGRRTGRHAGPRARRRGHRRDDVRLPPAEHPTRRPAPRRWPTLVGPGLGGARRRGAGPPGRGPPAVALPSKTGIFESSYIVRLGKLPVSG